MWIIPDNLHTYHFAQDMEASTLDLKELSEILSQSVMWRSKPSRSSTWSKRLKRGSWILRLSGQILKPSLGQSFVEKWTSSLEGFLANHLAQRGEEVEMKTLDTSGPILLEASKSLIDLPLFSWRTSKASSHQNSEVINGQTQRVHPFCFMSLENWRDWVTKQRQEYSQRVKSEHLIKESVCLSWRVAPILASQGALLFQQCLEPQAEKGLAWNTPQARDHKGAQVRAYKGQSLDLPAQVLHILPPEVMSSLSGSRQELQWATPQAGSKNHLSSSPKYYKSRTEKNKQVCLNGQTVLMHQIPLAKLNPRWVETLMGLPVGWTMPSCVNPWTIEKMSSECLGTESCQPQLREHLESSGTV